MWKSAWCPFHLSSTRSLGSSTASRQEHEPLPWPVTGSELSHFKGQSTGPSENPSSQLATHSPVG